MSENISVSWRKPLRTVGAALCRESTNGAFQSEAQGNALGSDISNSESPSREATPKGQEDANG